MEGSIPEGSWYWSTATTSNATTQLSSKGLLVMMAWMRSKREGHKPYLHLFKDYGWDCLVCQSSFFNLWFPKSALAIAVKILDELAEDLNKNPRPVVFASYSGGTKSCTYMIIQILQGKNVDGFCGDVNKYKIVRECTAGFVFDSTPMDFVSDVGVCLAKRRLGRLVGNSLAVSFGLQTVADVLNSIFGTNFNAQDLDMKNAFYAAAEMAPSLFFCSKDDGIAPFETIETFCAELQREAHCYHKVTLLIWEESDHVAHLYHHPREYTQALFKFLSESVMQKPVMRRSSSGTRTMLLKKQQQLINLQSSSKRKLQTHASSRGSLLLGLAALAPRTLRLW